MIIDSHLHVWSDDAERYPWAGEGTTEAGSVELLLETMARHGVHKACIVQPIHYLFDNRYVADCLARYRTTFSGIAIMDRRAPDAVEQLERLVGADGFEGLRMHLGRADDPAEWAAPDQDPIWRKAEELGACMLSFGPAEKQPAIAPIIARHPGVNVILDHLGGAPLHEDPPFPRLRKVLDLARYPNVYVKFTPQAAQAGAAADVYPFPDQRSMSGSTTPSVPGACCGEPTSRTSSAISATARGWICFAATWHSSTRKTRSGCSPRRRSASGNSEPRRPPPEAREGPARSTARSGCETSAGWSAAPVCGCACGHAR